MNDPRGTERTTEGAEYAERLTNLQSVWWKRWLDVQRPYRWNLRRMQPGYTLDVGCGIGRNLSHIGGEGVGVDHNVASVATCRSKGFIAFTPDDFMQSEFNRPGRFDSLLCSHVVEHMTLDEAATMISDYLPMVRPGGKVILITPQERGFRSDHTHVAFADFSYLDQLAEKLGLVVRSRRSFPFPRAAGKVFTYNEFVLIATK